jgi:hypothetical protein
MNIPEDKRWFMPVVAVVMVVRFVGFWAALALLVWLIGWITLPSWLVWALAVPAMFSISYSILISLAQHRAQFGNEPSGPFWLAMLGVLVFWAAVGVGLWWWLG